jgi:hypothetical protein
VPSKLNLRLKIHLPVMTLEPTGRETRSHVLLVIKSANYSTMAWHQFESARATWTEVGTNDKADAEVANRVSLSTGSQNLTLPAWSSDEG